MADIIENAADVKRALMYRGVESIFHGTPMGTVKNL